MESYTPIIIITILSAIVVLLLWRSLHSKSVDLATLRQEIDDLGDELVQTNLENAILTERLSVLAQKNLDVESQQTHLLEIFSKERVQISEQFTAKFSVLANEILESKSRSMNATSSETITAMLAPFGEKIDKFRERIEQESRQRYALENEVKRLAELNMQMSQEANNLTTALRGNSKNQGDWGEMILETLLENSGLKRDIHFRTQDSIRSAEGDLLRPDVILCLPDEKEVIIDSKVSLTAYLAYCEAVDETSAKRALAAHVVSVRNHIAELGKKSYQILVSSPDFVIMFVPNEPAFLIALQADNNLWHEAYQKGVVLSSPTNLFAVLRIVDDLWRRDSQSKNALEIARQGGDLYDKFVGFAETFLKVGQSIKNSEEHYDRSLGQLITGKGNLVSRTEKLRQLGIKTTKQLPTTMRHHDDQDELALPTKIESV